MDDAPIPSSDDRARSWLLLAGGIVVTIAATVGLVKVWPEAEPRDLTVTEVVPTTGSATGVPELPEEPSATTRPASATNLFASGAADAIADIAREAGNPDQVIELALYPTYAFLAYRDPANPGNIDRRMWRDGEVDDPDKNPIDDRVNADTEPALFGLGEVNLDIIGALTADAVTRYPIPVEVTHILIDRFLPFDERVLIRVYATPTDGRSGGGYVSYDTAGTFVKLCC